ncbi:MAG: glycosyltransferase family 39 protein [Pirellulales bacterium]|nr:glycosyltransferase family 39 protein [Pirellulales bacterium]
MKTATAKRLVLLLVAALVVRLAVAGWWQSQLGDDRAFAFGDSQSYWDLAQAMAQGEDYRYGAAESWAFRTPGYPGMLAPIFLVAGQDAPAMWGRVLGCVCGMAAVGGVWWLARALFGATAGWIAGLIAAFYPGAIATSVLVLSEAPFCPLMLANLGFWIIAWRASTPARAGGWALVAGMTAGAATLVRPSWFLFLPFAILIGLIFGPRRRRHLALGMMMTVGLIVVMGPWWVRNFRVLGRFVPTTTQVGASLYDGLSPEATGASQMDFVDRFLEEERAAPNDSGVPFELRVDARLRDTSLAWTRANPADVARLTVVKFARLWNPWPNEPSLSTWPVRLAMLVSFLPVVVLALVGAIRSIHWGWAYVLCWLPAVYFTGLHVIFVSSIRYRQPVILGLIVLAAGALVRRAAPEPDTITGA